MFCEENILQEQCLSNPISAIILCVCLPASGLLLFMFFVLFFFFSLFFFLSLQAVETNLASKDSHWVFVNEVRAPEW